MSPAVLKKFRIFVWIEIFHLYCAADLIFFHCTDVDELSNVRRRLWVGSAVMMS